MELATKAKHFGTAVLGIAVAALLVTAGAPASVQAPVASAASSDYFLKIEGVDGESTNAGHKGEIQIESWSWGVSNSGSMSSGGGAGAGKVNVQDISFTKRIDKSSPKLFESCVQGTHIPKATLVVARSAKGGTEDYYRVTLSDATCTSWTQAGTPIDAPTETVSLNFTKMEIEYLAKGSRDWMKASWDLAKGTKI